jgi:hypothetical protein
MMFCSRVKTRNNLRGPSFLALCNKLIIHWHCCLLYKWNTICFVICKSCFNPRTKHHRQNMRILMMIFVVNSPGSGPRGQSPRKLWGFEELQPFIWTTILNQPHNFYQTKKTWLWVLILNPGSALYITNKTRSG